MAARNRGNGKQEDLYDAHNKSIHELLLRVGRPTSECVPKAGNGIVVVVGKECTT